MKHRSEFVRSLFIGLFLLSVGGFAAEDIKFMDARIFTPLKGSNVTAGYVEIENKSKSPRKVVLSSVEGFKAFETHETIEDAGKMSMKKVDEYTIAPESKLKLKPGGKHLMLFDPVKKIADGDSLAVKFKIDGKEHSVQFKVIPRTKTDHNHDHH
ncbi:MAG: copper chaperone PCu(A)C [Bdellovibrionaceae bacterium]|nr:copper chaperone PCu(A)C [Pseudobdellovibrionaceae bacterium]